MKKTSITHGLRYGAVAGGSSSYSIHEYTLKLFYISNLIHDLSANIRYNDLIDMKNGHK